MIDTYNFKSAYDAFAIFERFVYAPNLNLNQCYMHKKDGLLVKLTYKGNINNVTETPASMAEVLENDIFYVSDENIIFKADIIFEVYSSFAIKNKTLTFKDILKTDACYEIVGEPRKARYVKVTNGNAEFFYKSQNGFEKSETHFTMYLDYKFVKIENF